jgi:hypothetical protein
MDENKMNKSISKAGSKFQILLPILILIRYGFTYVLSRLYCIIPVSFQYAKLKFSRQNNEIQYYERLNLRYTFFKCTMNE